MKKHIIILIFFLILISCNGSQKSIEENSSSIIWETLTIESRSQIITISKYEEFGVRDTCGYKEIQNGHDIIYEPINHGREYFKISQQEKDSLFKYVYEIIMQPVYTEQFATCYVGNISIGFSTGNTSLVCKYNSAGNWTAISSTMKRLHLLLKRKTRISEY